MWQINNIYISISHHICFSYNRSLELFLLSDRMNDLSPWIYVGLLFWLQWKGHSVSSETVRGSTLTETTLPGQAFWQLSVWVVLQQEVLVRNTQLISHHQPEEFGKSQKETPCVCPPPRIPLASIHLGWTMHAPPRRTLNQTDWPKTTWKLIPST